MLRIENTVERLLNQSGCRSLVALVRVMKFSREEELVANSMKIIRYSVKDEFVSHIYPLFLSFFNIESLKSNP